MKKYKWLIVFLVFVVALIVVAIIFTDSEDKYIEEISLDEVTNKIEKEEDFILYIKQTDCTHCKEFNPKYVSALKESKLKSYALNLTNLSDEEKEKYNKMFDIDGTPTVLFFEDGNESLIRIEGAQSKDKVISKFKSAGFLK